MILLENESAKFIFNWKYHTIYIPDYSHIFKIVQTKINSQYIKFSNIFSNIHIFFPQLPDLSKQILQGVYKKKTSPLSSLQFNLLICYHPVSLNMIPPQRKMFFQFCSIKFYSMWVLYFLKFYIAFYFMNLFNEYISL